MRSPTEAHTAHLDAVRRWTKDAEETVGNLLGLRYKPKSGSSDGKVRIEDEEYLGHIPIELRLEVKNEIASRARFAGWDVLNTTTGFEFRVEKKEQ